MSGIETRIVGTTGTSSEIREVSVAPFVTANGTHNALAVVTKSFLDFNPEFHPFLNTTFGVAMNQNITFGGSGVRATVIHAGVNSGSADSGTTDGSTTAFKLIQSGQNFNTTVGPGALVHNTTDPGFAVVTNVDSDTQLTLDTDIMATAEDYVINDIWVGTAVQGTWNFADSGKFTITSANDNDEATFTVDASHIWDMEHFTVLTGKIDLDVYDPLNNTVLLCFGLDGALVGRIVTIDDFIDTGDLSEQNFVIPKGAFGLSDQNVNSMRLTITRMGGAKPTIKFDDFQWESSGESITFKATTPTGTIFHITELRIRFRDDDHTNVLTNGTMPGWDTTALMGVSTLANGIVFSRIQNGVVLFAVTLKNMDDFEATGSNRINEADNGTGSGFTYVIEFPEPIVLSGGIDQNFLAFTINDDLSGLSRFTAAARGALESAP